VFGNVYWSPVNKSGGGSGSGSGGGVGIDGGMLDGISSAAVPRGLHWTALTTARAPFVHLHRLRRPCVQPAGLRFSAAAANAHESTASTSGPASFYRRHPRCSLLSNMIFDTISAVDVLSRASSSTCCSSATSNTA
jgi:hypothetical protein